MPKSADLQFVYDKFEIMSAMHTPLGFLLLFGSRARARPACAVNPVAVRLPDIGVAK